MSTIYQLAVATDFAHAAKTSLDPSNDLKNSGKSPPTNCPQCNEKMGNGCYCSGNDGESRMAVEAHVYTKQQVKSQSGLSPIHLVWTCNRCNQHKPSTAGKEAAEGTHYVKGRGTKPKYRKPSEYFTVQAGTWVCRKDLNDAASNAKGQGKGGYSYQS